MISRRQTLHRIAQTGVGAVALWQSAAFAAVYLDIAQAQKLLLPEATRFEPLALDVAKLMPGTALPRGFAPQCWTALAGNTTGNTAAVGWVLSDRTVGKYELIDYAAGFAPDGSMTGLEILAYRESHGAEIRNPTWRKQFAGRKGAGQLRFGEDIRNISGATLSCQHVTEAAQRLSALVQGLR